jgi:glutamate synthase (NADPH/NADH) large chain
VLNRNGNFEYFLNRGMVELSGLDNEADENFVRQQIEQHIYWTGSAYAKDILDHGGEYKPKFVKALPVEYKMALQQQMLAELDRKLYDIREREEIADRA